MRPLRAWFGRLSMAGACLAWAGCGGGDVPDPDSDATAAAEPAANVVNRGGPVAPAEAPAAEAPAPEVPAKSEPVALGPAVPPPAEAETPPAAPAGAAASKGDPSGTEEMLRMAAAPAPADAPPGSPPAPTPAPDTPSAPAGPAMAPAPGVAATPAAPAMPGMNGPPGTERGGDSTASGRGSTGREAMPAPGIGPTPGGEVPATMPGIGAGGPSMPGGPAAIGAAGEPGGFGMPGGSADPNAAGAGGPRPFYLPNTAAMAFLSALTAKDKDRLSQATARRAATEAVEKHRKVFAAIIEQSISDDELDEMSKAMAGYQVVGVLPAKSTGRIGVVVAKVEGRDRLQRTLTLRKEKEGWKVLDITDFYDFRPGGVSKRRTR